MSKDYTLKEALSKSSKDLYKAEKKYEATARMA